MPYLMRACSFPGCTAVTTNKKYCDQHKYLEDTLRKESHRNYKKRRTDKREMNFYNSKDWLFIREVRLRMDKGLCQSCKGRGITTFATMVHHIVEVKVDWNRRLDLDNLVSLCDKCHNEIDHQN